MPRYQLDVWWQASQQFVTLTVVAVIVVLVGAGLLKVYQNRRPRLVKGTRVRIDEPQSCWHWHTGTVMHVASDDVRWVRVEYDSTDSELLIKMPQLFQTSNLLEL